MTAIAANLHGLNADNMSLPGELKEAASRAGIGSDEGAVLEFLDKYVLALDLKSFSSDIWLEEELIRVNIFPPEGKVQFAPRHPTRHPELFHPELERIGNQINWVMKRLLDPQVFYSANLRPYQFYWSLEGSRRAPCRDSHWTRASVDLSGVDLFDLYLDRVYKQHRWQDRVIEMLKSLDDILMRRVPELQN